MPCLEVSGPNSRGGNPGPPAQGYTFPPRARRDPPQGLPPPHSQLLLLLRLRGLGSLREGEERVSGEGSQALALWHQAPSSLTPSAPQWLAGSIVQHLTAPSALSAPSSPTVMSICTAVMSALKHTQFSPLGSGKDPGQEPENLAWGPCSASTSLVTMGILFPRKGERYHLPVQLRKTSGKPRAGGGEEAVLLCIQCLAFTKHLQHAECHARGDPDKGEGVLTSEELMVQAGGQCSRRALTWFAQRSLKASGLCGGLQKEEASEPRTGS